MKKILTSLTIGFASIAAFSYGVHAQYAENPIAFNNAKKFKSAVFNMAALEAPPYLATYMADEKNINSKAVKDFQGRFNEASHTMWFSDQNGFVSYFQLNGFGDRAYYDKKGHWQYSLIFYGENKLPKDMRAIVKSTYYDFDITLCEEVRTTDDTVFLIHLEDKGTIRIVKLSPEGDMETFQELAKQ